MAELQWYRTPVNSAGVATGESVLVTVWFGPTAPPDPGAYALVLIDSDGDGLISRDEWRASTEGPPGQDQGGTTALFDGDPGGSGNLYSAVPYTAGETGLKDGLGGDFAPIDPGLLDPTVLCFAEGTRIATPHGTVRIDTLGPGDMVTTERTGPQRIQKIWTANVNSDSPNAPVQIVQNTLGDHETLRVSPNHRVLVEDPAVELMFGATRALVMAKSLINGSSVRQVPCGLLRYYHILLRGHEMVRANGLWSETFFIGNYALTNGRVPALSDLMLATEPAATKDESSSSRTSIAVSAQAPALCLTHAEGRLLAASMFRDRDTRPAPYSGHKEHA